MPGGNRRSKTIMHARQKGTTTVPQNTSAPDHEDDRDRALIATMHAVMAEWRAFRTAVTTRGHEIQASVDTINQRLGLLEAAAAEFRDYHRDLNHRVQSVEILVASRREPGQDYPPTPADLIRACEGTGRQQVTVTIDGRDITREFDAPCDPHTKWVDMLKSAQSES